MLGAVFGVMLIACTNVANLQLARAAERMREVALRMTLGAGRVRIIRQLLLEGLMLSAAGAALGLGIAKVGITLFNENIGDTSPPFWIDIRIDLTVLAFVSGLTIIAALAASLVPALRATRQDLNSVLKDEGRGTTALYMGRLSRSLVIVEVLLSCCLLIVSGLMIKGIIALGHVQYPYATKDVLVGGVSATSSKYPAAADKARLADRIEAELRGVPGVRDVSLSSGTPESSGTTTVAVEGETYASSNQQPSARRLAISTKFFDVLRVGLLSGRPFSSQDGADATSVAIVDQDFATKVFGRTDVLGRRLRLGGDASAPWLTIVGIVPRLSTARSRGRTEYVFVPLAQSPQTGFTVLASAATNPVGLVPGLRSALLRVDEDIALSQPDSLAADYWRSGWHYRVFGTLFMSFGLTALLLASAGLYGVMAFSVKRRTNEIGVRMALGANRTNILRMVLFQGMWRCVLGVVLGLWPAYLLGGAMTELLFNVTPTDPLVVSITLTALLTAGFLASVVPALRAASVHPMVALRNE
jgi:predicted permease